MGNRLRGVLILMVVIYVISVLFGLWSQWTDDFIMLAGIELGISAILLIITLIVVQAIKKNKEVPRPPGDFDALKTKRRLLSPKAISLLAFGVASRFLGLAITKEANSALMGVMLYVIPLLIIGYAFSRWSDSEEYVPIAAASIIVLVDSLWYTGRFMMSPTAQFRFGPEIVIFAADRLATRLSMMPLTVVLVWGPWKIAETLRQKVSIKSERQTHGD